MRLVETPWEEEGARLASVLKDVGRELTSLVREVGTPHELMIEPVGVHTYQLSWSFLPGHDIPDDDFMVLSKTMQHVASRMLAKHGLTATMLPLATSASLGAEAIGLHVELPKNTRMGVLKYLSKNVGSQDLDDFLDENVDARAHDQAKSFVTWLMTVADELKEVIGDIATGPVIQLTQVVSDPKVTLSFYLEKDMDEDEAKLAHGLLVRVLMRLRKRETNNVHRDRLYQLTQLAFWNALDWSDATPSFYIGTACMAPLGAHAPTIEKLLTQHRGKLQESASEMDAFDISKARTFISSLHGFRDRITAVIEDNAREVTCELLFMDANGLSTTNDVMMIWVAGGLDDDEVDVILKLLKARLQFVTERVRPTWLRKSYKEAKVTTQRAAGTHTIDVMFPLPSDYEAFIATVQQELNE